MRDILMCHYLWWPKSQVSVYKPQLLRKKERRSRSRTALWPDQGFLKVFFILFLFLTNEFSLQFTTSAARTWNLRVIIVITSILLWTGGRFGLVEIWMAPSLSHLLRIEGSTLSSKSGLFPNMLSSWLPCSSVFTGGMCGDMCLSHQSVKRLQFSSFDYSWYIHRRQKIHFGRFLRNPQGFRSTSIF